MSHHAKALTDRDEKWILDQIKTKTTPTKIIEASIKNRKEKHEDECGSRECSGWKNHKYPPGRDKILLGLRDLHRDGAITWENQRGGRGLKSRIELSVNNKHLAKSGIMRALADLEELKKITNEGKLFQKPEFVKFVMVMRSVEGAEVRYGRERLTARQKGSSPVIQIRQRSILDSLGKIKKKQKDLEDYRLWDDFEKIEAVVADVLQMPQIITDAEDYVLRARLAELDVLLQKKQ